VTDRRNIRLLLADVDAKLIMPDRVLHEKTHQ